MYNEKEATMGDTCWVRVGEGKLARYFVQQADDTSFGFSLHSDDQSWPGGFGLSTEWTRVPASEVPRNRRAELAHLWEPESRRA